MWLNIDTMPLQALVDKVARSNSWSRIGWTVENEEDPKCAKIVYDVVTRTSQTPRKREISFKEICEMFEWKWFTVHPSRQTICIEHTAKHLKDLGRA